MWLDYVDSPGLFLLAFLVGVASSSFRVETSQVIQSFFSLHLHPSSAGLTDIQSETWSSTETDLCRGCDRTISTLIFILVLQSFLNILKSQNNILPRVQVAAASSIF